MGVRLISLRLVVVNRSSCFLVIIHIKFVFINFLFSQSKNIFFFNVMPYRGMGLSRCVNMSDFLRLVILLANERSKTFRWLTLHLNRGI